MKNIPQQNEWVSELVDAAESAVIGYEKYLKDELNYQDLARIMKNLRSHLPIGNFSGTTGSNKQ
tara:strand:- start:49 stop:240 length:192 start_codon:yes stop_codon:yes gene_type:complete